MHGKATSRRSRPPVAGLRCPRCRSVLLLPLTSARVTAAPGFFRTTMADMARARALDLDDAVLDAQDSDDPKGALVNLLLRHHAPQ